MSTTQFARILARYGTRLRFNGMLSKLLMCDQIVDKDESPAQYICLKAIPNDSQDSIVTPRAPVKQDPGTR